MNKHLSAVKFQPYVLKTIQFYYLKCETLQKKICMVIYGQGATAVWKYAILLKYYTKGKCYQMPSPNLSIYWYSILCFSYLSTFPRVVYFGGKKVPSLLLYIYIYVRTGFCSLLYFRCCWLSGCWLCNYSFLIALQPFWYQLTDVFFRRILDGLCMVGVHCIHREHAKPYCNVENTIRKHQNTLLC